MLNRTIYRIHRRFLPFFLAIFLLAFYSCTKDDPEDGGDKKEGEVSRETPKENPPSFDTSKNEKGQSTLFIDVREFKKHGVQAEKVVLRFLNSELSSYDITMDIDQFLDVAQFLKENEKLTDPKKNVFKEGLVDAQVEVLDAGNNPLSKKTFNLLSSGSRLTFLDKDLINPPSPNTKFFVEFGIPYFIQSKLTGDLLTIPDGKGDEAGAEIHPSKLSDQNVQYQEVIFEQVPGSSDEVHIKFLHSSKLVALYGGNDPETNDPIAYLSQSKESTPQSNLTCHYRFKITNENGYVKISEACSSKLYFALHNNYNDHKLILVKDLTYANNADQYLFRLVPSDLVYSVEDDGHNFGSFAFSEGNIDVAYAQTILNCSGATLTETVGQTESRESTRELSTEESFEMYSEQASSFGVSAGVSAGFSAFGADVSASLEVSTDHSFTSSSTTSNTKYFGFSETITSEVSREREIEVGPYTKLSVFDAVSTVEAVPIDFVHRYTLRGKSQHTGNFVSGKALNSALESSGFGGVVLDEGTDYLKLSLRGTYHVDKLITTRTELQDLGKCD